jgi:hypothetical protein
MAEHQRQALSTYRHQAVFLRGLRTRAWEMARLRHQQHRSPAAPLSAGRLRRWPLQQQRMQRSNLIASVTARPASRALLRNCTVARRLLPPCLAQARLLLLPLLGLRRRRAARRQRPRTKCGTRPRVGQA